MARPERNDVDYHPKSVHQGQEMFYIENKYGNDGYATTNKISEVLGSTEYHFLDLENEITKMFLSSRCAVPEKTLISIIDDLVKLEMFDKELWDEKILFSQKFIDSIRDAYRKRSNDCITRDGLIRLLIEKGRLKQPKRRSNQGKRRSQGAAKPQRKEKETIRNYKREEESAITQNSEPNNNFILFWKSYPKKKSKGQAVKTWDKLKKEKALPDIQIILSAIAAQKASHDWQEENGRFIPHPSTWLNAQGWEDEETQISGSELSDTAKHNVIVGKKWLKGKSHENRTGTN